MTKPLALTLFSLFGVAIVVWAQPFPTDNTAKLAQVEQADRQFLDTLEQQEPAVATVRPAATKPVAPIAKVQAAPNPMPVPIEPTAASQDPAPVLARRVKSELVSKPPTRTAVRPPVASTAAESFARASKRPPAPGATGSTMTETERPKTTRSKSKVPTKSASSEPKTAKRSSIRAAHEPSEPMVRRATPVVREVIIVQERGPEARPLKHFRFPTAQPRPRISIFSDDRDEPDDDD